MRFGSSTIGAPVTGVVSITPAAGSNFFIGGARLSNQSGNALETILGMLGASLAFGAVIAGTAGAGNKAICELNNPNASGSTLFVYALDVFVATAMAVNVVLDGTTLAPVGTPFNLLAGAGVGIAKVGGGNQLTPTGSLVYSIPSLAVNVDYALSQPFLFAIPPNHNLQLQGQTVNQAMTCNVRYIQLGG